MGRLDLQRELLLIPSLLSRLLILIAPGNLSSFGMRSSTNSLTRLSNCLLIACLLTKSSLFPRVPLTKEHMRMTTPGSIISMFILSLKIDMSLMLISVVIVYKPANESAGASGDGWVDSSFGGLALGFFKRVTVQHYIYAGHEFVAH